MKNFSKKIYIYIFLLFFGGFSFVFAENTDGEQQVLGTVSAVSQLFENHLNTITIILTIVGVLLTLAGAVLVFFGWSTKKDIEKTYGEKLDKFAEAKEGEIREMIKEHSIEMEILKKKILFLKSVENDDSINESIKETEKFLKRRNFQKPEIKNIVEFTKEDIKTLWDKEGASAKGIVVFFPSKNDNNKIESILDILKEEKLEEDIPLIIYWPHFPERYNTKLLKGYQFCNLPNNLFTLALSIYNMLAIVNLEKYKKSEKDE